MWLSKSSTIVLLFLVVVRAHNSRYKRQSSQEGELSDSISNLQHADSHYQFPLPPQAKPRNLQLSPGVQSNVKANVKTISQNKYNQPPHQLNDRLQYQPPIYPQQTSTQTHIKLQASPQQHQYAPEFQPQPYHSNNYTQAFSFKQVGKTQGVSTNDQSTIMHVPKKTSSKRQHDTISTSHSTEVVLHEKIVSMQQPVQSVIQKLPASEIESNKGITAKDKDSNQDQYLIYYYYYDDDNKTNVNNPTLNFDDISDLEAYDQKQENNQPEKSNRRINSPQNTNKALKNHSGSSTLQPVTILSQATGRVEIIDASVTRAPKADMANVSEDSLVSNIYRYGNNVPRFPATPNLVDHPIKNQPEISNRGIPYDRKSSSDVILQPDGDVNSGVPISTLSYTPTLLANVEPSSKRKLEDINEIVETKTEPETTETPTTTTTEPTTTTEEPTTTEKRRQRTFGFRQRSGLRKRRPGSLRQRRPSSTTTTTDSTTTHESSTKRVRSRFGSRSFRRSHLRSSFRRNRFGHSNDDDEEDKEEDEVQKDETTTESSRGRKRQRYIGSRRYGRRRTSSRISTENTEDTSTTDEVAKIETTTESSRGSKRRRYRGSRRYGRRRTSSRTSTENTEESSTTESSRSRPSIFNRRKTPSRPRLPFIRGGRKRFGHHDEEEKEEATSSSSATENTSETTISIPASTEFADEKFNDKIDTVEEQQTTTTEKNRFAGLFKRRKRPTLFG
ncbi:mediator of DNA damage checkpoint protein 1-like [Limulus polyphemus]|uniref:Mediator of DNA damage checkpoint protein 1-like n=1 Tax=Limulus polyphemus TaxID=6850 RepID=A0ABM1BFV4_LIMPO|nr:mediator of DNA damage checkpoint protein 1-like [Limulus polyphemus]